ncbi:unnamed protein product [Medioppia subpectinata]|uniref:MCM C-terminal AAA(+) ATPase domain-containing protein n=1 Tax=Medioppia subpectinata TaxID=1979941 RepID=A0A7R9PTC2_9ACAR|nr:unnamed protein product [Medioppia subpectinata]CAG2099978.1 unnamed protein product [Medioppia subpectinata]
MEDQCVTVAKGGVICSVPTRTTIIAASNPKSGHFDSSKSIRDNLRFDSALLSRFDLIYILKDDLKNQFDDVYINTPPIFLSKVKIIKKRFEFFDKADNLSNYFPIYLVQKEILTIRGIYFEDAITRDHYYKLLKSAIRANESKEDGTAFQIQNIGEYDGNETLRSVYIVKGIDQSSTDPDQQKPGVIIFSTDSGIYKKYKSGTTKISDLKAKNIMYDEENQLFYFQVKHKLHIAELNSETVELKSKSINLDVGRFFIGKCQNSTYVSLTNKGDYNFSLIYLLTIESDDKKNEIKLFRKLYVGFKVERDEGSQDKICINPQLGNTAYSIVENNVMYPKDENSHTELNDNKALISALTNPENLVYEAKRMFGKGYYHSDIQKSMKYWPFKLKEIKASSTDIAKEKVEDNIVPAYFHDGAKQRTLGASKIAFSNEVDSNGKPLDVQTVLLAEPTAAAMAYGSKMIKNNQVKDGDEERILVFDLGGGTYDVSILEFNYDKNNPVGEVKATDGDNYLGGGDFDNIIIEMARNEFKKAYPEEVANTKMTKEQELNDKKNDIRLRQEAIKIKSQLSSGTTATFNLSCYRGEKGINFEVTRSRFERASKSLFDRLLEKCKGVLLSYSKITPVYTDDAEFQKLNQSWNRSLEKLQIHLTRNSDDNEGPKLLLVDNVPLNLNIETYGGVATPIIEARTAIPAKNSQGNRPQSSDNYHVGSFTLNNIAPARKGEPQIEVTIEVDQNNILKVTAVDKKSGMSEIFVQNMTDKLTDEDIERMKNLAAEHAKADEIFSKRVAAKNQFESLLYEFQDKIDSAQISEEIKTQMRAKCDEEEGYLRGEAMSAQPEAIKARMEEFSKTITQMMSGSASEAKPTDNGDVEEVL